MKEQKIVITIYNKPEKKPKKERDTAKTVLIFLAVYGVAFVISMIVTFWVKGSVPDTLIQYAIGAGGLEALLLAGITIAKELKGIKKKPVRPEKIDEERD